MSDQTSSTDTPGTPEGSKPVEGTSTEGAPEGSTESTESTTDAPAEGTADTTDASTEGDGLDDDEGKTFDATYVRGLRSENAQWRTKVRELEAKYAEAKTPEQVAEITADFQKENTRLERELLVGKVAREHDLPEDLASLLKGDDEKALRDHAKVLAKYVTTGTDPELSGGLNPSDNDDPDGLDPRKLAERVRRRR